MTASMSADEPPEAAAHATKSLALAPAQRLMVRTNVPFVVVIHATTTFLGCWFPPGAMVLNVMESPLVVAKADETAKNNDMNTIFFMLPPWKDSLFTLSSGADGLRQQINLSKSLIW